MTYARAHLVDVEHGGFYHCISRCVRRGWLCGRDAVSGRSFEHRREWIESGVLDLASLFAVNLHGYAVMSNHYHCVLEVRPERAAEWSDEEVAERWCRLCPGRTGEETAARRSTLLGNARRLAGARQRLASLSCFMRFVNEPIARRANREDEVTGRFWEGRFKSVALLDEAAVVACMAYVDLNPVRPNVVRRAEDAAHTSIARRLREPNRRTTPLAPLSALSITLAGYRELLAWTAEVHRGGVEPPRGTARRALNRLRHRPDAWLGAVKAHRFRYRAYGVTCPEFLGEIFTRWAKEAGMAIQYIQPGKPNQNAYIERFNRTYREGLLDQYLFTTLADVREATYWWMLEYNGERPHASLDDRTPAEARQQAAGNSTFELSR